MFILLPFIWLIAWLVIGGLVAAFSGLSPHAGGLVLFFVLFLGGGFGLPVVGGLGWFVWQRIRQYRNRQHK